MCVCVNPAHAVYCARDLCTQRTEFIYSLTSSRSLRLFNSLLKCSRTRYPAPTEPLGDPPHSELPLAHAQFLLSSICEVKQEPERNVHSEVVITNQTPVKFQHIKADLFTF